MHNLRSTQTSQVRRVLIRNKLMGTLEELQLKSKNLSTGQLEVPHRTNLCDLYESVS